MAFNPVQRAIDRVGGQTSLARILGVKQPTIFRWAQKGIVPPKKVLLVEKVTGISRHQLNPIIYPPD